jgi:uncharacterized membrane protein YeaQ/YmgE (transglycosylase-associated protein family)
MWQRCLAADAPIGATFSRECPTMTRLFGFIGATAGGYVGWYLGVPVGTMTAFMVSMVGSGVGLYYGRKLGDYYSP